MFACKGIAASFPPLVVSVSGPHRFSYVVVGFAQGSERVFSHAHVPMEASGLRRSLVIVRAVEV